MSSLLSFSATPNLALAVASRNPSKSSSPPPPPPPQPSPQQQPATAALPPPNRMWVNPNSSRISRLAKIASSLSAAPPALIPSVLSSVSPPLSEADLPLVFELLPSPEPIVPVLRHFLSLSVRPLPLFLAAIRVHASAGNISAALSIFGLMKSLSVTPGVQVYNLLIRAAGRTHRPWKVKALFSEMLRAGVEPNRGTYISLFKIYTRARFVDDALWVFRRMRELEMPIPCAFYGILLPVCIHARAFDDAHAVLRDMTADMHEPPNRRTFSAIISLHSVYGDSAKAEATFREMVASGIVPNIYIMTSMIQCFGRAGLVDKAIEMFDYTIELGIVPDGELCGCLLNVMAKTPWAEMGKVIACIERANPRLAALLKCLIDGDSDRVMLEKGAKVVLQATDCEVTRGLCNSLIDICVSLELLGRANVLLDLAIELGIYGQLQWKSATGWGLDVRGLSRGAALTALHAWIMDLWTAMEAGDKLPPVLVISTGLVREKPTDKTLLELFQSHLSDLKAPFQNSGDQTGKLTTTTIAAEAWLREWNSS